MTKLKLQLTLSTATLAASAALSPATAQNPAPIPGSPGVYVPAQQLATQLKTAVDSKADPAVAEVGVSDQFAIHEVHRLKAASSPAVHMGWTELHYILDGGGTLVTGGQMTTGPRASIEGGVSRTVKKGDAIIVPPNTPHMYTQVEGSLTYLEVRFVTATSGSTDR